MYTYIFVHVLLINYIKIEHHMKNNLERMYIQKITSWHAATAKPL